MRARNTGTMYKRGNTWYTKILIDGKYVRQSTGETDKAKALKVLNSLSKGADLNEREHLAVIKERLERRDPSPAFAAAWEAYENAPENIGQTSGARATDLGRWRFFVRWLHGYDGGPRCRINCKAAHPGAEVLDDITPLLATEFVNYAKTVSSANTVNKYVRTFRRVWNFNHAEKNPWAAFSKLKESPHLRRALSDIEVQKLIGDASGELRTLFALGAYTGLRMSDCARIRWSDFDEYLRTLMARPSKTAHSSGVTVAIPVHPSLARILGKRKRTGRVMPELAALPEWKLSDVVCAHFRACGFEAAEKQDGFRRAVASVGFHSLRSTFITNMANIGAPMAMVQAIVGHMTPEMSQHYYRANADAARVRVDVLPDFCGTGDAAPVMTLR